MEIGKTVCNPLAPLGTTFSMVASGFEARRDGVFPRNASVFCDTRQRCTRRLSVSRRFTSEASLLRSFYTTVTSPVGRTIFPFLSQYTSAISSDGGRKLGGLSGNRGISGLRSTTLFFLLQILNVTQNKRRIEQSRRIII